MQCGSYILTDLLLRTTVVTDRLWRPPQPPDWTTANRIIVDEPAWRLRCFDLDPALGSGSPDVATSARLPALIVPPEVNHSVIADFAPEQSLVQCLQRNGFPKVSVLEWLSATAETAERDVDDSIRSIHAAIMRLGGRVHLVGLCQGGWESAVVAARQPDQVASLTLVAAPIDFHAGMGLVKLVSSTLPLAAYQAMVWLGGGCMPGRLVSKGFDNLLPFERYFLKVLMLWNHADEASWLERFDQLDRWYRAPKDLPGPMYLRAVQALFKENQLIQGRFMVLGQPVQLARITCPTVLIAGDKDHITPREQVWAAEQAIGSMDVLRVLIPAGHVGTFIGRSPLAEHWPAVLQWIRAHEPR